MEVIRKTILNDEAYLRQVSKPVIFVNNEYKEEIELLEKFCLETECFALAAIQIGIPKRIIYLKNTTLDVPIDDMSYNESKVLINPVILERKGHTRFLESCESCLDNAGVVDRPYLIVMEYYDINGQIKRETFKGFESTVLSHEYDHLNGILHLDLIDEADIMQLNIEQRKVYRDEHPYEVISETCDYEELRAKKLKK